MRRRGARRVPRAQRRRLVRRAQVPGLPRLGEPRAGAAVRLLRSARAPDRKERGNAGRRRRRHVHRRRLGPRRAHRGDEGAEQRERPGGSRSSREPSGLASRDARVFNHASTMGLNAVITRALPKIGFLTTEGHRDILDRGRIWRPPARQSDTSWRRSFGDAARPLVPRYLRRGVTERLLVRRERSHPARRGAGAEPAGGAEAMRGRGRRDLPAERLRRSGARATAARARARGARRRRGGLDLVRDLAAREGVRARLDDRDRRLHEADLHRLRAPTRRAAAGRPASPAS